MKKILILYMIFITQFASAQVPQGIPYQSVIRNSSGAVVANQNVSLRFSIRDSIATGAIVYRETHAVTTTAQGLTNVNIGMGTPVTGTFSTINWGNNNKYIQVEADITGGTNYIDLGTTQMMSVPYAQYAKSAGSLSGGGGTGGFTHYVGEKFGGGVVFHLWKDSTGAEHGLIVALTDQSTSAIWSNISSSIIGTSAQSPVDGLNNSNNIVAQSGHNSSSAKLCLDLVSGGQSDWYLPSIQELNALWNNYYYVSKVLSQIPGATLLQWADYWSSTEVNGGNAWVFLFHNGNSYLNYKYEQNAVRAIRAF